MGSSNLFSFWNVLGRVRLGDCGALHSPSLRLGSSPADLPVHCEGAGRVNRFHISPSPVEWPSPGPDPGLSYRMNKLVHRLARLKDTEGAREEGEREEEGLEGPSGDSEETGNSCTGTA